MTLVKEAVRFCKAQWQKAQSKLHKNVNTLKHTFMIHDVLTVVVGGGEYQL